jgi:hypothetical protein
MKLCNLVSLFLLSIYSSNESIGFVHGKSIFQTTTFLDKKMIFIGENFRLYAVRNLDLYRPHRYELLN